MYTVSCPICSDIFSTTSEVFATKCGHIFHHHCLMQWLETDKKKRCPQCRNHTSESSIYRVFINFNFQDDNDTDPALLQSQVAELRSTIDLKEKQIKKIQEKCDNAAEVNRGLRMMVRDLENKESTFKQIHSENQDQIKYYKNKVSKYKQLKEENERMKLAVQESDNMQIALAGSFEQVENIIRQQQDVRSLALMCSTVKRGLLDSEKKNHDLEKRCNHTKNSLKLTDEENKKLVKENLKMRRELEFVRKTYEEEKNYLRGKIAELDSKISRGSLDGVNNSIRRIALESPINYNRTPKISKPKLQDFNASLLEEKNSCSERLSNELEIQDRHTVSSTEKAENIKSTETKSPYLSIKPCNSGFLSVMNNVKFKTELEVSSNSKRTTAPLLLHPSLGKMRETKSSQSNRAVVFDGLGGSSKNDGFPIGKPVGLKRHKSSSTSAGSTKLRKLSADAAKSSTKVTNFFSCS